MNDYQKVNHKSIKIILIVVMVLSIFLAILFFYLNNDYLKKQPLVDYPKYTLSTTDWTSDSVIITVTNDSKDISGYSFDGGVNFQPGNTLTVNENSNYTLVIKDINDRLSKSIPIVVRNIDKTPPEIIFANPTTIQINSKYNLRTGVIVKDNDSGINNNYVITPNTIDTNIPGTYNFTYSVFDKVGNYTEKVRTIIVSDQLAHTYYRSRSVSYENYLCEPYLCNCTNTTSGTCPTGFTLSEGKCCSTCHKTCKNKIYGEWGKWQKERIVESPTLEVETKIE